MPLSIIRNDITKVKADALDNPANPDAVVGSGTDYAIHKAAGPKLLKARQKIGNIPTGQAAITRAYSLPAKFVIHTVSPAWHGGHTGEIQLLYSCYFQSLALAAKHRCRSVAFPLIASGNYKFPKALALQTALMAIQNFLLEHEMDICLVVFDADAYSLSEKLFLSVKSYIDERYVLEKHQQEYPASLQGNRLTSTEPPPCQAAENVPCQAAENAPCQMAENTLCQMAEKKQMPTAQSPRLLNRSLKELVEAVDETFSQALFRLIDARQMSDPEVYKRANLSRKLFSKIRKNKDYRPSKPTALALAIALRLNLDETKDLIGRAGFALTHSSKFDIIVEYCIQKNIYNIFELNEILFAFDQPLLGGNS